MTLATVCGIAIFLVVTGFFLTISLLGMVASDSASTKVKENSVFVIKLDGTISERAEEGSPIDEILDLNDMSVRRRTMKTSKVSTWRAAHWPSTHQPQPNNCAMP